MIERIFLVLLVLIFAFGIVIRPSKIQAEYFYKESTYTDYEANDNSEDEYSSDTKLERNEYGYIESDYMNYKASCLSKKVYPKYTSSAYTMYWCEDSSLFCDLQTKTCVKPTSDQNKIQLCAGGAISSDIELKRDVCTVPYSSEENGILTEYPKDNKLKFADGNLGGIISVIIKIVYWLAGLSMMAMIIIGGLEVMTSLGVPEKMKMGYGKMTGGLIGFLIIFSSYLIVKLVETIFGISILQ